MAIDFEKEKKKRREENKQQATSWNKKNNVKVNTDGSLVYGKQQSAENGYSAKKRSSSKSSGPKIVEYKPVNKQRKNGKSNQNAAKGHKTVSTMSDKTKKNYYDAWTDYSLSRGISGFYSGVVSAATGAELSEATKKKVGDSKAFQAGNIAGQMTTYGLGYSGAGKATAKAAGKVVASKVGKKAVSKAAQNKLVKSAARKTLTKAGQNATKKAVDHAAKQSAKRIIEGTAKNLIADATIGTLLDSNVARSQGYKVGSEEWKKEMAANAALNLGIGGAMEIAPTLIKGIKGGKLYKTAKVVDQRTGKAKNIKVEKNFRDFEKSEIEGKIPERRGNTKSSYIKKADVPLSHRSSYNKYIRSTDTNLKRFVERSKSGEVGNRSYNDFGEVSKNTSDLVQRMTGKKIEGKKYRLKSSTINEHISKRHGANGMADKSMSDNNDLARIKYVLDSPDEVEVIMNSDGSVKRSREFKNSDGSGAEELKFKKKIDGHYYVAVAVPDNKNNTVNVITAYIEGNNGKKVQKKAGQVADADNGPLRNARNALDISSAKSNIPNSHIEVKDGRSYIADPNDKKRTISKKTYLPKPSEIETTVSPKLGKPSSGNVLPRAGETLDTKMPVKAQKYLNRAEKSFEQELKETFGFAEYTEETKNQIGKLAEKIKAGTVTAEDEDVVFDRIIDEAGKQKIDARDRYDSILKNFGDRANHVRKYTASRIRTPEERRSIDQVKSMTADIGKYRRELEKIKENVLLTPEDDVTIDRLLKGYIRLEDIRDNPNFDAIRQVYQASVPIEEKNKALKTLGAETKGGYRTLVQDALENSDLFRDKKMGLRYSRETAERNMIDIAGTKDGKKLNDEFIRPIHKHEAESNRMKVGIRDYIRNLRIGTDGIYDISGIGLEGVRGLDTGKKASESTLVQLYGEKLISREQLRAVGADADKIAHAAEELRGIYNNLIDAANTEMVRHGYDPIAYRKDYFPHFEEEKPDSTIGKIANKLGFNINVEELPTDIAGLTHTFRPGKKWFRNALSREGKATTYDAIKGLDIYLEGVSDVIYHTEDIQKLRMLENEVRLKYSDKEVRKRIRKIMNSSELDDVQKQTLLDKEYAAGNTHLSNFATWLRNYTDGLAGKKSISDRVVEQNIGRTFYNVSKAVENRVAANMVGVNPASWLTNFIPIVQGSELSNRNLVKGMAETVQNYFKKDGFEEVSDFMTNRKGADPLWKSRTEKVQNLMTRPMQWIDEFTSSTLVRAMYNQCMDKGMSAEDAIRKADEFAAGVIADRSKGSLPTLFNAKNPLSKILTMYQVEVNNQWSYLLKDLPRSQENVRKLAYVFAKYAVGAYLFNEVYEAVVGRRPALDPISWVNDFAGDVTGTKVPNFVDAILNDKEISFDAETKKPSAAIAAAGENIAEDIPFIGGLLGGGRVPIQNALPSVGTIAGNAADLISGEKDSKAALSAIGKEFAKPGYYVLPPVGGGQLKKIAETSKAIYSGGVYGYDKDGNRQLKYAVDKSPVEVTKGMLFGPYSAKNASGYVDSGFRMLSAKRTAAYDALVKLGMKNSDAEKFIRDMPVKESDARKYILNSNLTAKQKNAVGKNISKKQYDYSSRQAYELSSLPNATKEKISKIAKKGQIGKQQAYEAYQIQKDYGSYTAKALALLNSQNDDTIRAFNIYDSTLDRAKVLKKADITAGNFETVRKEADTNGNSRISRDEIINYLERTDYTRKQKYALFKALTTCKESNNPYR